ncbi:MAG: putative glycoside hydrolase [Candidatus Paceibacterota bacterium]|jgi:hypothetical protein
MIKEWRKFGATRIVTVIVGAFFILAILSYLIFISSIGVIKYSNTSDDIDVSTLTNNIIAKPTITHIATPIPVKAIYITACTASEKRLRNKTIELFKGTELNSIVVDLKDYTGTVSYSSTTVGNYARGRGCIVQDFPEFINELHELGIYVIARITVFQDPLYASKYPESAIKKVSNPESSWHDNMGLAYIHPGSKVFWDYIVDLSKEASSIGFDELNYDYIRFPSDGNIKDILYNISSTTHRTNILSSFFAYLRQQMSETKAVLSADLFGLTTSASGDLGIGQVLEDALIYFDYVGPMVYPSHFAYGFIGIEKPATEPYKVVKYSMDQAFVKIYNASSTPNKLRPWLQAFNLGATYTPEMVRKQMQATYDAGFDSWMLWNAGSVYDKRIFLEESPM